MQWFTGLIKVCNRIGKDCSRENPRDVYLTKSFKYKFIFLSSWPHIVLAMDIEITKHKEIFFIKGNRRAYMVSTIPSTLKVSNRHYINFYYKC